ncbi:non-ribosomal peptide synthetase [cf. Phormidesmis sp. LEGE 11477]|uniref:non-ribosomal peptide synthetase n=1 Tax=cf. Phormidesmis sp. LEGE 11477 TaxID=1828680 RepID=UPI001881F63D|nr:non-ribosomal peptide synthetase [cf. Phormidesmis sp. LEGE 11477]MBE9060861.1 amino acid adenylation domain-containing protein [cf. Phormidesmis sp. LEGE 11477]
MTVNQATNDNNVASLEVKDIYELSPMQQGMLFHTLYEPETGVYFEQRHCLLEGNLDAQAFRQAWQQVVNRYDILRSEFHWEETDKPLQVVYESVELPWVNEDWRSLGKKKQIEELETFLLAERLQGFQLDYAPLMRCALFQLGDRQYRFVWSYHHLLMDGWCNGVLIRDVLTIYQANLSSERTVSLPPVKPYKDYILWLQGQDSDRAKAYWQSILEDFQTPTSLGIDRIQTREENSDRSTPLYRDTHREKQQAISVSLSQKLTAFAKQERLTLNTLMQGAWAIVLSRYSGSNDVLFGITVSGRPPELSGVESMVGLFINTVPLRVNLPDGAEILPWLQQLQQTQRERETYSYSNLSDLQSWSDIPAGSSLFDSLLIFENYPTSIEAVTQSFETGFSLKDGQGYEKTNYPLTLVVIPGETIQLSGRYDTQHISEAAIDRLLEHLAAVLESFADNPQQRIDQVSLLAAKERSQLREFAQGKAVKVEPRCVHQQFEDQAVFTPDATAITYSTDPFVPTAVEPYSDKPYLDNRSLTYQQLNERANQIARCLLSQGAKSGTRVGVCLERSIDMIASLLAILKAGSIYVPLDPAHPKDRLDYISQQSQIEILVTTSDVYEARSLSICPTTICLDNNSEIDSQSIGNLALTATEDDTAYILYTSGSTGKPKGVPVTHRSLTHFLAAMSHNCRITAQDRLLAVTTLGFDIAALEIFLPLVSGAQVVITPQEITLDGERLAQQIEANNITIMQATPATWRLLLDASWSGHPSLTILCGGEALDIELAKRLLPCGQSLYNLYGPTETTIWSGALRVNADFLAQSTFSGSVPIGAPIANTQFYVLDQQQRQVPVGIAGELYIGGAGLSDGYWNRPDLTAERFVDVDVSGASQRLYRTGDRVRYREDGTLDFLGRLDSQVKLRGFRIELGAVEAALTQHPDITQAVVVVQSEQSQLLAYIKPIGEAHPTPTEELRQWLGQYLPDYMLPSGYMLVDTFPLTPNGKIDRRSLPAFAPTTAKEQPPSTQNEKLVAGIWSAVLDVEGINLDDSFFELGGHSLLATQTISQIRQVFNVDLPLRLLFENPKLQDFVAILEQAQNAGSQLSAPITRSELIGSPVLSFAQQRQWLIYQLDPNSPAYNIPIAIRLIGNLSIKGLEQSIAQLINRHETLRTIYPNVEGAPTPVTLAPQAAFALEVVDLRQLDTKAQRAKVIQDIRQQVQQPFDLEKEPLLRSHLLQLNEQEHILLFTQHHIVTDGWSIGILQRELTALYQAASSGNELDKVLPPLSIHYSDYVAWQKSLDLSGQVAYWKQQLNGLAPLLTLSTDYSRPAEPSGVGASYEFRLSQKETDALQQFSQQTQVTLYMTLLAAFNILLYRYSQITDLAVGTPIANRQRPELEKLIGLFVNTLVIRTSVENNPKVSDFLTHIRQVTLDAYAHQDFPFEQLIDELAISRSRSHTPLIQVMFALQNDSLLQQSSAKTEVATSDETAINWSPIKIQSETAKFDLTLDMRETDRGLVGQFEYRADLFSPETIHRMAGHFRNLLRALPQNGQQRISELPMLSHSESKQLQGWQQGEASKPLSNRAIHQHFETQAAATPNAVALIYNNAQLSYAELNKKANQLARYLQQKGVQLETPVGIWAERSPTTIITILAILKAGGTYIPLDPNYPIERLEWMIADTRMVLLVKNSAVPVPTEMTSLVPILELNTETAEHIDPLPETNLPDTSLSSASFPPTALAYILYTSGSTGQPKGVCVSHQSVTRLVIAPNYVTLTASDVLLQAAPLTFDASTFEVWGALLNGGKLVLLPEQSPSLEALGHAISTHRVTTLWLTAGLFNLMVDEQLDSLTSVRQLLAGGDVLSVYHLRKALKALPNTKIINGYGPTEGTTFTCCHTVTQSDLEAAVPIGYPLSHTQVYVLDADLQRVPVGIVGELYIGGAGVARGYLNRPDLTAEKFIPNPFYGIRQRSESELFYLYKTGDRVRYRADGALKYLGRLDTQVKIRGFRIEPGEVEAALERHTAIQQAAVVAWGDGAEKRGTEQKEIQQKETRQKRLVAYLEATDRSAGNISSLEIRQFLLEKLPDYMMPAKFVWMPSLPLTTNGKVDRRALPTPDWTALQTEESFPKTEIETALVSIFSSLLPAETIGIHDNFFELGGDSILAMQIVSRAAREGITLSPSQLFQYQTIAELATVASKGDSVLVPQSLAEGEVPLTPIQHWFFEQDLAQPHHFNQSVYLSLPHNLNKAALEFAIAQVFTHHDAFRLRFYQTEQGWQQAFSKENTAPVIQWFDYSHLSSEQKTGAIAQQIKVQQTSLNIQNGSLIAVCGFESGEKDQSHLFIAIHHLLIDGVSWRILLADLQQAYSQAIANQPIQLQPKTHSYQQWAIALAEKANSSEIIADLDYWQALSSREFAVLLSDFNADAAENTIENSETVSVQLFEAQTHSLLQEIPAAYNTQITDALLTAFMQTLTTWIDSNELLIDLESYGRFSDTLDLSRTVGWFTALYPISLSFEPTLTLVDNLRSIQANLQAVPNHGLSYGLLRYLSTDISQRHINPPVSFNYLGQIDAVSEAGFTKAPLPNAPHSPNQANENLRVHLLDVNSWIEDGQLQIEWIFSQRHHKRETIAKLARQFVHNLSVLIESCHTQQDADYSSNDFGLVDLDSDAIAAVLDQVTFTTAEQEVTS